eukprot:1188680-Prorocentrum_minimum.AAC.6
MLACRRTRSHASVSTHTHAAMLACLACRRTHSHASVSTHTQPSYICFFFFTSRHYLHCRDDASYQQSARDDAVQRQPVGGLTLRFDGHAKGRGGSGGGALRSDERALLHALAGAIGRGGAREQRGSVQLAPATRDSWRQRLRTAGNKGPTPRDTLSRAAP